MNTKNIFDIFIDENSEIEIYKKILSGESKRFPKNFWSDKESDSYAPLIIRYMVESVEKWKMEDIPNKIRKEIFAKNKLAGMLSIKYDSSPYKAIMAAYPKLPFNAWDFVNAPNEYWQGETGRENAIRATKWLIEDKLKWSKSEVKEKITHQVFIDNNLLGMLKRVYNCSIWEAINDSYPNQFMPWEIGVHVANEYWTKERGIAATKWLIEEKLKWDKNKICENLTKEVFIKNNLYGMLQRCFESSPYRAINETYPNLIKEWNLKKVPRGFWSEETVLEAIDWLVKEILLLDNIEDIKKVLTVKHLKDYGLNEIKERYGLRKTLDLYEKKYFDK